MELIKTAILTGFLLVMLLSGFLVPPYAVNKILRIKHRIANRTAILLLFTVMGIFVTNIMVNAVMLTAGEGPMYVMPYTACNTMVPACGVNCMEFGGGWIETSLCNSAQNLEIFFIVFGLGTLIWRDVRREQNQKTRTEHKKPAHHKHTAHH